MRTATGPPSGSPAGDLLRAWHRLGVAQDDEQMRASIAQVFGISLAAPRPASPADTDLKETPPYGGQPPVESAKPPVTPPRPVSPPVPRELLTRSVAYPADASQDSEDHVLGEVGMALSQPLAPMPAKELLLNPKWLRGIFSSRLSVSIASREVDLDACIRQLLSNGLIQRIPWRTIPTMMPGVRCMIDAGIAMDLLAADREQVLAGIRALAGPPRVSVAYFQTLPDAPDALSDSGPEEVVVAPNAPLLVLTDFGHFWSPVRRSASHLEWLQYLRRESARGTSIIVALVPLLPADWPVALRSEVDMILWDRQTGVAKRRRNAL